MSESEQVHDGCDDDGDGVPDDGERVEGAEGNPGRQVRSHSQLYNMIYVYKSKISLILPLPEDVEDAGPEEGEGEEDEEAVGGLAPTVLADQLPTL